MAAIQRYFNQIIRSASRTTKIATLMLKRGMRKTRLFPQTGEYVSVFAPDPPKPPSEPPDDPPPERRTKSTNLS